MVFGKWPAGVRSIQYVLSDESKDFVKLSFLKNLKTRPIGKKTTKNIIPIIIGDVILCKRRPNLAHNKLKGVSKVGAMMVTKKTTQVIATQ